MPAKKLFPALLTTLTLLPHAAPAKSPGCSPLAGPTFNFHGRLAQNSAAHEKLAPAQGPLKKMKACLDAFLEKHALYCKPRRENNKEKPDTEPTSARAEDCTYFGSMMQIERKKAADLRGLKTAHYENTDEIRICWQDELETLGRLKLTPKNEHLPAERERLEELSREIARLSDQEGDQLNGGIARAEESAKKIEAAFHRCRAKKEGEEI
jgi:hypothetical protein